MQRIEGLISVEDYLKQQIALEERFKHAMVVHGVEPNEISIGEAYRLQTEMLLSPQLNGAFTYCPFRRHRSRKDKNKWY